MGGLVELTAPSVDVTPGSESRLGVLVFNTGRATHTYEVMVSGELAQWAFVAPSKLVIEAGQLVQTTLILRPPRDPGVPAGPMPLFIILECLTDPEPPEVASGQVVVLPFEDHHVAIAPVLVETALGTKVKVEARNDGNSPVMLLLEAACPDGSFQLDLPEPILTVSPGDTATATLSLDPSYRHVVGPPVAHEYGVQALSLSGASSVARAQVRQRPTLGLWLAGAFVALVLVAVLTAVAVTVTHSSGGGSTGGRSQLAVQPQRPTDNTAPGEGPLTASPTIVSGPPSGLVNGLTDSAGLPLAIPTPLPGPPPAVPTGPNAAKLVLLHRLYDPALGDYLYTTSQPEVDAAKAAGLVDQGVMGKVFNGPIAGTVPVYRVTMAEGHHLFTSDGGEIQVAVRQGGRNDGLVGYWYADAVGGSLPVYRSSIDLQHCLTTSPEEHHRRVAAGWHDDGIKGYVLA